MSKFIPQPELTMNDRQKLADDCLSIARHLMSGKRKDSNLVLSPLSLLVAHEMKNVVRKHSHESSKASEILNYVFADASDSGGPLLSCANGVWFDWSFNLKPESQEILQTVFRATCAQVDIMNKADEVTNQVNEWAENKTNGLIRQVISKDSVHCCICAIFANAIYFKGIWDVPFCKSMTGDADFFLLDGSPVRVPFMTAVWEIRPVQEFDGFKMLELTYQSPDYTKDCRWFSLHIFLPNERDGLTALLERMGSESGFLDHHLPVRRQMLANLCIPKFEIDSGFKVSSESLDTLIQDNDKNKLVMGSESNEELFQKAVIKVDEQGTEAAACSVDDLECDCEESDHEDGLNFVADHPFLFVLREGTKGAVLFVGQVLNPLVIS